MEDPADLDIRIREGLPMSIGFRAKELRDVRRMVNDRAAEFLEAWNDNFGA